MAKDSPSFELRPQLAALDPLGSAVHIGINSMPADAAKTPLLSDLLTFTLEKRLQVIEHFLCTS